ncbi:SpoIID/LytB domain-containing protein [candidate division WOR-3 bacterium]|nr:SpoIID/LytB domain-containing protein [candidate division WOR-3 bacterium]
MIARRAINSLFFIFDFIFLILLTGCARVYKIPSRERGEAPMVRVTIAQKSDITIEGKRLFIKLDNKLFEGRSFKITPQSILIGKLKYQKAVSSATFPIEITSHANIAKFNHKSYRGKFIIYSAKGGSASGGKSSDDFLVVNKLDIEDYLKGVVPCELETDNLEALKTQAIISRSFALATIKNTGKYDLKATVESQVYGGMDRETKLATRAVKETHGIVCTYNGKVISARYSSTCGGRTKNGGLSYLKSIHCPFCKNSPHYKWERSYSKSQIFQLLKPKVGSKIKSLKICKRDNFGRVKEVEISTNKGNYSIKGTRARTLLGLKSTFFNIIMKGNKVVINGGGYGHGIGLCQWGALEMAEKGFGYRSILKYYYNDIKIEKIY